MVAFKAEKRAIELVGYDSGATLTELVATLEDFRLKNSLKTRNCRGCGKCCKDNIPVLGLDLPVIAGEPPFTEEKLQDSGIVLPEKPDLEARRKSLLELQRTNGLTGLEAAVIYEYNNSEPLILAKQKDGACLFLKDRLCSVYGRRPYSCGLYLCNMGERLSYVQEMILRQGTWHAYMLLGWVAPEELPHNPFLKTSSYDELLVKDFEFGLENALEQLFFYF